MAITFVSSQEEIYTSATPIGSLTFSVATGTRTHGVLVVKANIITSTGGGDLITDITWNGVSMTFVLETSDTPPCTEIWRTFEFGGGTHDIVLTFTAAGGPPLTTGMQQIQVIAEWYDSDAALEAGNTNTVANGTTDPASITVDTTATGELVTGSYVTADNNVATATAGTLTQDWDQGGNCTGGSYLIAGAAGTQTLTWDRNATGLASPFNQAVACFREIAAGGIVPVLQRQYRQRRN